ncbi:MAG TPA: TldD/PmbA family protein [Thermoanaerobaculia bacterium]|nr:TldD/PmbA family protein [Thermoanaerobaculia bacterium]
MNLTREDAKSIIDRVLKLSKADDASVSIEQNREANLRYAHNEVSTSGDTSDAVLTVRSSFGKRSGSASANQFDDATLERVVRRAEETARFAPEDPEAMPLLGAQEYVTRQAYDEATANAAPDFRASIAANAIAVAKKGKLEAAGFITNAGTTRALGNSKGLFAWDRTTLATFSNTVRTADGTGSGWAGTNVDRIGDLRPAELVQTAAEKAVRSVNAKTLQPGTYTVILEPAAVADMLLYLSFAADARAADEGRSFFARKGGGTKIGEKVVSDKVSIWTDPADSRALGSIYANEGLPTRRMPLFENGVLKSLTYSRYWAQKMDAQPTPTPTNLIMKGGTGSLPDLIRDTRDGVLVTRLWYIRFLNPQAILLTGLTRDGVFKIERGRIRNAVKNFRFNDSPVSVFANVDAMSREMRTRGSEAEDFAIVCPAVRTKFTFSSLSDAV